MSNLPDNAFPMSVYPADKQVIEFIQDDGSPGLHALYFNQEGDEGYVQFFGASDERSWETITSPIGWRPLTPDPVEVEWEEGEMFDSAHLGIVELEAHDSYCRVLFNGTQIYKAIMAGRVCARKWVEGTYREYRFHEMPILKEPA